MPDVQEVVGRLNDAVRRDWKALHNLLNYRVPVNQQLLEHPTIIVVPVDQTDPQQYVAGLLGIINGLVRDNNEQSPIEACFDELGELMAFKVRGDESPVTDLREVAVTNLVVNGGYRVKDLAGNWWEGVFTGSGTPPEQGVHLRMRDGKTVRVYFHDVVKIITA